MGQKVHPLGFRVGITKKHQSQWFVRFHKHKYAQTVLEDRMLRETLTNLFPQLLNPIWKMPQKKRDSQDELSIAPKITKIKIERGLIPYEIVIQIHAENCNLIKTSIENLKVNRDLLCQLQKMRRYLQHLRGKCPKLNNFSLISSLSSINQSNTKPNAENKIINKKESKNFVLGTLQNSKISPSLALALALCPPKGGLGQGPATPFSPKPPFGGQGTEKRSVALSPQRGQGFGQPFPSLPSGVKKGDARLSRRGGFATAMAIKKTNESFWKMPSSKLILSKARQKRYLTKYELRHQRFLLKRLKKRQSIRRRYVDFVGKNLFLTKKDNFLKIILLSPKLSFSLLQSAIKNKDKGNFLGNLQKKALLPLLKKQFLKNLTLRSTTQRAKANSFKSERGNVSNQSNQKVVTASNPEGLKKQQTNSQNKMSPLALTLDSSGQGPATLSPSLPLRGYRILTPKGLGKGVKKGGKVKRSAALSPRRGQGLGQPVARRAKTANIFQTRIKKKFLSIFINRMNNKFLQNLKILLRSFVSSTLNTSFPNQTNSVLAPLVGVNNPFPNPEGAASLRDDKGFKAENVDSFPFSKATESLKFSKRSINVLKSNLNTLRSAFTPSGLEATQKAKAEKKGKFKEIKTENLISSGTISKKNSFTFDVPNPLPVTPSASSTRNPLRGKGSDRSEGGLRASAYQRDQRVQNRFLKKHNLFKNLLFTSTFGLQPTGQRGRQYQYKVLSQLNKFMFILEEKAFKKMEILRKNFITFASIPKTEAYNYYEILILLKQVKELISKIKRKNKISLAFAPFDLQPYPPKKAVSANSEGAIFSLALYPEGVRATPALYVTPFESEEGVQQRLPITGQKFSDLGLLQDKSNLDNRSMSVFERIQKQADNNKDTNQSYLDNLLNDDNNLKSIKFNLLFKKLNNIDNECRKIKFIEYLKGIVKKHRNNNIYLYLSTISDARKDLRKLQQFTKRNASFLFGLNTNQNEESLLALPLSPPSSLPFLSEAALSPRRGQGLGSGVTGKGPATLAPEGGIGEGPQAKELAKTQMTERISNVLYQMNKKSFHLTYSCNLLSSTNTNLVDSNKTLCEVFLEQIEKQRKMLKHNTELIPKIAIKFYSVNAKTVKAKASVVADSIVDALEKRKAFRKVIKDAKEELMRTPGVKGVKIQVAGRLNGAEIARSEWVRAGRVPLQTLRANLDYCYKTASTIYGIIGIKVWVFKGYTKLL